MRALDAFKIIIIIQLFFAVSFTLISHTIPDDAKTYIGSYDSPTDLKKVGGQVEQGLQKQADVPVVEMGALVFYSGNLLIDLLLNMVFAVPEMFSMLVYGIMSLLPIPTFITHTVQVFTTVIISVMYFIAIIQLLTSIRAGRVV